MKSVGEGHRKVLKLPDLVEHRVVPDSITIWHWVLSESLIIIFRQNWSSMFLRYPTVNWSYSWKFNGYRLKLDMYWALVYKELISSRSSRSGTCKNSKSHSNKVSNWTFANSKNWLSLYSIKNWMPTFSEWINLQLSCGTAKYYTVVHKSSNIKILIMGIFRPTKFFSS